MTTDAIAALKDQLRQLDALATSGALSPDAAASARAELERRLVDAVMASPASAPSAAPQPAPAAAPRVSRQTMLAMAGFVLLFGAALYAWRGNLPGWSVQPGSPAAAPAETGAAPGQAPHAMGTQQIEGMLASLTERLKAKPEDAEGWLMLGRSYSVLGRFSEAVPAYRKVLALQPANGQALADLADALAMVNGRSFQGEPTQLIAAALKAEPDNLKALALAGTLAFETGDAKTAVRHWERAVKVGPPDSDLVKQLQSALGEARQAAGLPAVATTAAQATPAAVAARASVSGRVELSATLAAKAAPDDTVFIFARPAEGSRMPLAILKKRVRDLPADFTLDDSMAMSPAARLSGAPAVVVGARVSKSGQAMPQPGDLEGLSASVAPGASGLRIVIEREVR
ncbi:c-type cytochrome biogenesis protein CcmI [Ideonella sp. 4Y11]|uniref:C-type cytochrome biogenesis protein CcmI n=1 Tax=Ideonella aquatica TaxID=2824119 RepID=A0A940YG62_9BURK|nr:c-type cytochrome biogenesis protein CcmI [Ideonella aquatica]MBQ0957576.1 c-type cytochrome biogenesis protein CcmI [Ideonella aquatica]